MILNIDETFNRELPADAVLENTARQVFGAAFSNATPRPPSRPQVVHVSDEVLAIIGLMPEDKNSDLFRDVVSGKSVIPNTDPYAMCYGGHQFGSWAGQLGDGRAINLTEVVHNGQRWALQLKGAGKTPYSRTADGLAVLRSSVREHLCSEAMHHLGVPTTRSLSLSLTGDEVLRDMLYDGHPAYEKGAVVCRVAPSFIRFGNFEIFAARQDIGNLRKLADYTIRHLFPHINGGSNQGYVQFFREVVDRTLRMVIHWQRVGFVHGVMNTDNMSILGLTMDYGPYGWLEDYDHNWTPNTTDAQGRRYRFGHQPSVALWNLVKLANALIHLTKDAAPLQAALDTFRDDYEDQYLSMMRQKLGLQVEKATDNDLVGELEKMLQVTETDMTIFFRKLSELGEFSDLDSDRSILDIVWEAFYKPEEVSDAVLKQWETWFEKYADRLSGEANSAMQRQALMKAVNPKYVLRNYMAQLAIDKADKGDYGLIDELYQMLKQPYAEQPEHERWFAKRPEWARDKVGCSMLSCSS